MQRSLWKTDTPLPRFPALDQDAHTDVLIVGGGLTGLLCAHRLAQAGIDYLLIEADQIAQGTTGNTTAKITAQHGAIYHSLVQRFGEDTSRAYWRANEAALDAYRTLARQFPCDLEHKDSFLYATQPSPELEQELAALQRLGIPAGTVEELPLPFPVIGAIRFRDQAQFHPLKLLSQLAQGLNIRERTPARSIKGDTVYTDQGKIRAEKIIIATHFPIINKHGGYFLKQYQHRSYVLALENAPKVGGMYRDIQENGLSFRDSGDLLLLGGASHRTGHPGGGWDHLEAQARAYYPDAAVRHRWATQDCMTLDGLPYIGRYSRSTPDLFVATGYNKWGMTSSMIASMLLTDLIRDIPSPWTSLFDPSRTIFRPQLLSNILETTKNLLTPTRPRCPHLGCALKWDPQERTWDCPCHGSRFAEDGKLLDGPATKDLPPK
ncbi:MAG: FAD-dependent oxidoreductase [Oscillospiraceae bacterium]|nr:FAD-dependent oxidoreductase [Oscillospiraceae bacterium]